MPEASGLIVRKLVLLIAVFLVIPRLVAAEMLIGSQMVYTVRKKDTIQLVGARLGVDWRTIAKENGLDASKPLKQGQELRVNARKIVPVKVDDGIIINIPDRTLYLFKGGKLEAVFPVGLGKQPKKGQQDWSTPVGKFTIVAKAKNPTWYVPESIQKEMEDEGKPVKTIVPPGPDNPLGRHAMKTTLDGILIHETTLPSSIYQFMSHGCVRMMPEHMVQFFDKVDLNMSGELLYMPIKVAVVDQGRVLIEARRDFYGKVSDLKKEAREVIEKKGLAERVDWAKVERVVKERAGRPEDVTKKGASALPVASM